MTDDVGTRVQIDGESYPVPWALTGREIGKRARWYFYGVDNRPGLPPRWRVETESGRPDPAGPCERCRETPCNCGDRIA